MPEPQQGTPPNGEQPAEKIDPELADLAKRWSGQDVQSPAEPHPSQVQAASPEMLTSLGLTPSGETHHQKQGASFNGEAVQADEIGGTRRGGERVESQVSGDILRGATEGAANTFQSGVNLAKAAATHPEAAAAFGAPGMGLALAGEVAWHSKMLANNTTIHELGKTAATSAFGAPRDGIANQLIEGFAQFEVGAAPLKGAKAAGVVLKGALAGTEQTASSSPYDPRMVSEWGKSIPGPIGTAISAFAANPHDSYAFATLKAETENVVTNIAFATFAEGVKSAWMARFGKHPVGQEAVAAAAARNGARPVDIAQETRPDVVKVEPTPDGQFTVKPKETGRLLTRVESRTLESGGGTTAHRYTLEHEGQTYGMDIQESADKKTLNVSRVGPLDAEGNPAAKELGEGFNFDTGLDETAQEGANKLGARKVLRGASELAQDFPEAEKITGLRATGARMGPGAGESAAATNMDIDLNQVRSRVTVPTRADAEALGASYNELASQVKQAEKPALTTLQKAWGDSIGKMVADGKSTLADIAGAARDMNVNLPYGHEVEGAQKFISALAKRIEEAAGGHEKIQGVLDQADAVFPDMDKESEKSAIQTFFGNKQITPAHQLAVHVYMHGLGQQIARLGDAVTQFPDNPLALRNLLNSVKGMYQVFDPFKKTASDLGLMTQKLSEEEAGGAKDEMGLTAADKTEGALPEDQGKLFNQMATDQNVKTAAQKNIWEKIAVSPDDLSKGELQAIARYVKNVDGDPTAILQQLRDVHMDMQVDAALKAKAIDETTAGRITRALMIARVGNMISSPRTVAKIVMTDSIMAFMRPLEDAWGARSFFNGNSPELRSQLAQRAADTVTGYGEYLGDAFRAARRAWESGESVIDPRNSIFNNASIITDPSHPGSTWLNLNRVPQKLHTSIMEFFKTMEYKSDVRASSLRMSRTEGLSPEAAAAQVEDDMKLAFDPQGRAVLHEDALNYSRTQTFSNPLERGTPSGDASSFSNKHPLFRMIFDPIITIPQNAFYRAWERTPGLNRLMSDFKERWNSADPAVAANARAQMQQGMAFYAAAMYAAHTGALTGSGPVDPELRKQWIANNHKPYTLTIGGHEFDLTKIEPLSFPLELTGSVHDLVSSEATNVARRMHAIDAQGPVRSDLSGHPFLQAMRFIGDLKDASGGMMHDDGLGIISAFGATMAGAMAGHTFWGPMVKGLNAVMEKDPRAFAKFMMSEAQTFVPFSAALRDTNWDMTMRESRNMLEDEMSTLPGFSKLVEPRRNLMGEKIMLGSGFLDWANAHWNPMQTMQKHDDVQEQLLLIGRAMPTLNPIVKGADDITKVDLADRSMWGKGGRFGQSPYDRWQELLTQPIFGGKTAREVLTQIVKSPQYQALPPITTATPDGPRFRLVADALKKMQQGAFQKMVLEYSQPGSPNLAQAIARAKGARMAGRTGNQAMIDNAARSISVYGAGSPPQPDSPDADATSTSP